LSALHESFVGEHLSLEGLFVESLLGPPPHSPGLLGKSRSHSRIATEAPPDLVRTPERPVPSVLALAGMGETIAMPTQEIAPRSVQLGNALATGHAVHNAWANEIWPRPTEAALHANNVDGLRHILPITTGDPYSIGQVQPSALRAHIDRGNAFSVARPLPTTGPARP
jgi:hypothetical protein